MRLISILAVATVSCSTTVAAQSQRDLDAHEHGSATMNVALLDQSVVLELETPWNNLVGFEHQPRTDAQHALIDDARAYLNQPDALFGFEGTNCVATETVIEDTLAQSGHEEHEEHDHDEEHEKEHAEHDHDEEDGHSSLFVSYSFACDDIAQLETIDVKLLGIWPGFVDLDVQLIGPGGQGATELGQQQTIVDVKQFL